MLLLLTVGLLLIGLVTLVIGFLNSSLALDYISIAASALSFALVLLFTRLGRARSARTAGDRTRPASPAPQTDTGVLDLHAEHGPEPETASLPRASRGPSTVQAAASVFDQPPPGEDEDELDELPWESEPLVPSEPTRVPQSRSPYERPSGRAADFPPPPAPRPPADDRYGDEEGSADYEDMEFPIADYDELRVAEIVPLLEELEPDEIEEVRQRELAGRSRAVILDKLDELGDAGTGPAQGGTRAVPVVNGIQSPRPRYEPSGAGGSDLEDQDEGVDHDRHDDPYGAEDDYEDEEPEDGYGPAEADFPIADYDDLRLTEVLPLLSQLEPTELELVRQRELTGERRATLLNRIDALIGNGASRSPARQLR